MRPTDAAPATPVMDSPEWLAGLRDIFVDALRGAADAIEYRQPKAHHQPPHADTATGTDTTLDSNERPNVDVPPASREGNTATHDAKRVYSIAEIAQILGFHRSTTYGLVRRGEIRVVQIGGRKLVPATELERLLGAS